MTLHWIYIAISWILLRWHSAWEAIGIPEAAVLGTNWAWILAIVFLVVTLRVILFPIFVKQIKSQRAMQALQPKVKELQDKHKGDRETLQKEMMELYRKEKANPLMGCLPMFLQAPVFLGLFWVLRRIDPKKTVNTDIYTWTKDQWDSAVHAKLFGAPIASYFSSSNSDLALMEAHSALTVKVIAAVLVVIMMLTTYATTKQMILKTGWATDPQQRMIQKLMLYGIPVSLLVSGAIFPIGVIIYWVTNNLFTLGQQQWVLRKFPPPPMAGGKPGAPGSAGTQGKGPVGKGPVQPARTGLFGRGKANGAAPVQPTKPAVDGKALAPKPGAKPANAKKARKPAKRQG